MATFREDVNDDLTEFFNEDEFAISADYNIGDGATVPDITVVMEQEIDPEIVGNKGAKNSVYFFVKVTDIIVTPKFGDEIVTASATYTVEKLITEDDGVYYVSARRNERIAK